VNLVGMMIVKDEADRYLVPVLQALARVCDEIRVYDDGSVDGSAEIAAAVDRVHVKRADTSSFFMHEGAARQKALEWANEASPTFVLAVDADELIENGHLIREAVEEERSRGMVWTLDMQEIWKADARGIQVREDGGWRSHGVPILYRRVGAFPHRADWRIPNRKLASGRVPLAVGRNHRKEETGAQILHLGWTCKADRAARHARYVEHDKGRFHRGSHLDSIMWPDEKVDLRRRPWPEDLSPSGRQLLLDRIRRRNR
jgi:glycosyltransferase involved in cell wall biosynthesis